MAEEIRDLIEKIHEEGVKAAEEKARQIEAEARKKADVIIQKAKEVAEALINQAKEKNARLQDSTNALLKQASRDALINLKKEILNILDKVVLNRVKEALKPDELGSIITALVKCAEKKSQDEIVISLNSQDLGKLQKALLSELKDHLKKGIVFKAADDISAGFIISYDSGKSHYDFTDKALAEYISSQVKPQLAEILK